MSQCLNKFTIVWLVLLSVAPQILSPSMAEARAGGGQGYSGGGGHSGGGGGYSGGGGHWSGGGSSGGGSGDGQFIFQIIFYCFTHPAIGVPLALIIAAFIYFQYFNATPVRSDTRSRDLALSGSVLDQGIAEIRQHDPNFDPGAFFDRVGGGFLKLQAAWCAQDLKVVRPFISDGIHERFSLQFAEQKSEGYRDHMDGLRVAQIAIAAARSDDIYDQLSLMIRAAAVDFPVSLADGAQLSGSRQLEPFTEVWSFLRRRGAKTIVGQPGLLEGNCPNCAAEIAINESTNCTNCGALLRSGEYDWVLAEITQESEWKPGDRGPVPGLDALRQSDADLNVQALEDRASVIFWRKAASDRLGKLDSMRKVTSPRYLDLYSTRLRGAAAERTYFGDCAVGAVDTLKFIPAAADSSPDKALIGIRWSGYSMNVGPDGSRSKVGDNDPHHTLFVLMRKAGVKTEVAKGISSAHCPNCGAPEAGGVNGACEFCGTTLNDGSSGWVLDDIISFSDPKAQQLFAGSGT